MANDVKLLTKLYTGTLQQYTSIQTPEEDALYFVNDASTGVKSIYKGGRKLSGDFIIVDGAAPVHPESGVIYYISEFVKEAGKAGKPYVGFWNGNAWVALVDGATLESLDQRVTTIENWKSETPFVIWDVRGDRKHIVLDNHDNILAKTVDGGEVNLAMVSKWNVADFGSSTIAMNLNAKDGKVTINDSKVVATLDDVQSTVADLDVTDTEVGGSVVVAVNEEDGKVSNVKKPVTVVTATTTEGMEKTYDVKIGDTSVGKIDIPYCSSVLSGAVLTDMNASINKNTGEITPGSPKGNDALGMVFKKADGKYDFIKVDVSTFLVETEFKNGLKVTDGSVSVNFGENNDYLKFGEGEDGKKPLNVNVVKLAEATTANTGVADAADVKATIDAEKTARENADDELDEKIAALETKLDGKTMTASGDEWVSATGTATTAGYNVTVSTNTVDLSAATTDNNGLATALDAKTYVDKAVADKNVSAEGDGTYVDATAADNKVSVSAKTVAYAAATSANTGLLDAWDVKTVITENERVTAASLNELDNRVGKLSGLTTDNQESIVAAINEVKQLVLNSQTQWLTLG